MVEGFYELKQKLDLKKITYFGIESQKIKMIITLLLKNLVREFVGVVLDGKMNA